MWYIKSIPENIPNSITHGLTRLLNSTYSYVAMQWKMKCNEITFFLKEYLTSNAYVNQIFPLKLS